MPYEKCPIRKLGSDLPGHKKSPIDWGFFVIAEALVLYLLEAGPSSLCELRRALILAAKRSLGQNGGGGGSRTRVPCAFTSGIYMLSFVFIVVMTSRPSALCHFQVF